MPTNNPFTQSEQSNAQRVTLHETVKVYQNATDVWGFASDWTAEPINGKGIQVPLELSPNPSLAAVDLDGGAIPTVGSRNLDSMTVSYGVLAQSGGTTYLARLNNNKETAEDELMASMESDAKQFVKFLNDYASRGDGTHALAFVDQDDQTSATITVNGTYDSIGPSQLVVGGWYKFYNAAGTTPHETTTTGALQLLSKTASAVTFDQNVPTDVVSGDMIVPVINVTNAATNFVAGLPYIIDSSGTYFGKSRSSYTGLQAYENGISAALTAGALASTYFGMQQRGGYFGGGFGDDLLESLWILVNISGKETYYKLALNSGAAIGGLRTIQDNGKNPGLDLGFKDTMFTWFGAPLKACNSTRGDEIYFVNPKYLKKAVLKNIGETSMPNANGSMLVNSSGVPVYTNLSLRDFVGQFFSPTPHKLGKISGIQFSGVATQKAAQV